MITAQFNPFGFLEGPLESLLVFLNKQGHLTIGWAIVVLTVIVRLILLPLFVSQYRSARRMQEVAPLLQAVKKRYANDKRKQQEETMRIFQEHRVNPFGSCLPIVFQAPVFIALYFVLRDFTRDNPVKGDLSFMGIIPNIEQQFRTMGWHAVVLGLIYGLSQLLATEVGFATSPQTSETQRRIFRFIPLLIVGGLFLYPNVPAGLVLYWLTTNLWTGGQQVVLKRRLGPLKLMDASSLPPAQSDDDGGAKRPTGRPARGARNVREAAAQAREDASGKKGTAGGATSSKKPASGGGKSPGQKRRPPKKR